MYTLHYMYTFRNKVSFPIFGPGFAKPPHRMVRFHSSRYSYVEWWINYLRTLYYPIFRFIFKHSCFVMNQQNHNNARTVANRSDCLEFVPSSNVCTDRTHSQWRSTEASIILCYCAKVWKQPATILLLVMQVLIDNLLNSWTCSNFHAGVQASGLQERLVLFYRLPLVHCAKVILYAILYATIATYYYIDIIIHAFIYIYRGSLGNCRCRVDGSRNVDNKAGLEMRDYISRSFIMPCNFFYQYTQLVRKRSVWYAIWLNPFQRNVKKMIGGWNYGGLGGSWSFINPRPSWSYI